MSMGTPKRRVERVTFVSDGITIVGDLRIPEPLHAGSPAILLTGPLTGVRDQVIGLYAERLSAAGCITLAIDPRNFGESGGQRRQHEDPQGKLDDLRDGVSYLRSRPE